MRLDLTALVAGTCMLVLLSGCMNSAAIQSPVAERSLQNSASAWEEAIEAKDADRIAAFFAQDAVAMYPRPSPTIGREANRQAWAAVYSDPDAEHPITVERVEMSRSGDLGYIYGKWWSRRPALEHYSGGRYVAVWKPAGDQWQIVMLSANVHDDVKEDRFSR